MTARNLCVSLVLALGAALPAGAAAQGIQVVDAWSRPTPPGMDVGVAYFTIRNAGRSDRLLRVSSPVAKSAELHVSAMTNGVMKMEGLASVDVGSGAPVAFEPSGRHVMLMGLRRPLKEGDVFPLTLTFANAGQVQTSVRVRGADGKGQGHSGAPAMTH
ncbi:MAG TPA: copper chaperone PCu(A)C [Burkholderiales bacterium]|nr:copper chaperone PCu(A)C [Burkholderiales bacterium]